MTKKAPTPSRNLQLPVESPGGELGVAIAGSHWQVSWPSRHTPLLQSFVLTRTGYEVTELITSSKRGYS